MRKRRLTNHSRQPRGLKNLHIVVEQQQIRPFCPLRPKIAHAGKIKIHRLIEIVKHTFLTERLQRTAHRLGAAIVHDNDFIIRIGGVALNRADTLHQHFWVVL